MNSTESDVKVKQPEHDEIARQVREFKKRGGKIKVAPTVEYKPLKFNNALTDKETVKKKVRKSKKI